MSEPTDADKRTPGPKPGDETTRLQQKTEDPNAVREFISTFERKAAPEGTVPAEQRVHVEPEADIGLDATDDILMRSAFVDAAKLELTEDDKALYLKAVLNDQPVRFEIALFNGKMKLRTRSRYTCEQVMVFNVLKQDQKDGLFDEKDVSMFVTRLQWYSGLLMIEQINGAEFSKLTIPPDMKLAEAVKLLREGADEKFVNMSMVRFTAVLNAMRIHETKCARLGTEASNEGFWTPRD